MRFLFLLLFIIFVFSPLTTLASGFENGDSDDLTIPESAESESVPAQFGQAPPSSSFLKIISRAEWGADESWRFCSGFNRSSKKCEEQASGELWPRVYYPIKKIIIHETAGSSGPDTQAILRAIYLWHSITLGWGDLGYNYLIDLLGNVFEGRFGGDGVVAGHTYYSYTDSETKTRIGYNFNAGSLGIATIGNFQNDSVTAPMQDALKNLIVSRSLDLGLDPRVSEPWEVPIRIMENPQNLSFEQLRPIIESSAIMLRSKKINFEFNFSDQENPKVIIKNIPNVITHRDIDWTLDPPENLYASIASIRQLAASEYQSRISQGIAHKASLLSGRDASVSLKQGQKGEIVVEFKNDGTSSWRNYGDFRVYLAEESIKSSLPTLSAVSAASDALDQNIEAQLDQAQIIEQDLPIIRPGEVARFSFKIDPPKNSWQERKVYLLVLGDQGWFPQTEFTVITNALDLPFATQLEAENFPKIIFEQSAQDVTIKFKNRGLESWQKDDLRLRIIDPGKDSQKSSFIEFGEFSAIKGKTKEVKPGEVAGFSFKIKSQDQGLVHNRLILEYREAEEWKRITDGLVEIYTQVEPGLQAEIVSANIPAAVKAGWRPAITFKIKNTGKDTWTGGRKTRLLSWADAYKTPSPFYDKADWLDKEEAAWLLERRVKPGQTGTFKLFLRPPKTPATYYHVFRLEVDKKIVMIKDKEGFKQEINFATRVDF